MPFDVVVDVDLVVEVCSGLVAMVWAVVVFAALDVVLLIMFVVVEN